MPGRKRKATESANQPNKMWGSSSGSSSYHHHGSSSSGARRRGGSSSSSSRRDGGASSGRASSAVSRLVCVGSVTRVDFFRCGKVCMVYVVVGSHFIVIIIIFINFYCFLGFPVIF